MNHDGIKQIFENLAADHIEIQQFFHGDYDEILGAERNNMEYPLMWYETPFIPVSGDSDGLIFSYRTYYTILANSPKDQTERVRYNKIWTERIAKEVLLKLNCMDGFIVSSVDIEPVDNINNDHDQGWRVGLTITPDSFAMKFSDKFKSVFPEDTKPAFSWTITENAGAYTIQIEDHTSPGLTSFDSYKYKMMRGSDNKVMQILPAGTQTFTSDSPEIYIELDIIMDSITRSASGHTKTGSPGESFQFIYNPLL